MAAILDTKVGISRLADLLHNADARRFLYRRHCDVTTLTRERLFLYLFD